MASYDRLDIYERDDFRCVYCGFDGSKFETWRFLEIDHVDPNGPDELSNIVTCCRYCNACKWKEPCQSIEEAKIILARHNRANREYWEKNVAPRVRR
jgi:5-methylcytosine-specific restriction endonuclease McrA